MPLVRRIRRGGANIVVEAHGEVLFTATGDVGRWTNRFSQRVRAFTIAAAPSNKRPRWAHYGKPLKSTFRASTTYQPGRMRVYSAIGSSAPHAMYVDQGTGIYGGGGPYPAKILPPWGHGSPTLYESTWRPPSGGNNGVDSVWSRPKVAQVMIKGQKGQFFFDAGLSRAFRSMRLRGAQLPGEGGPKITDALNSAASLLPGFSGNTPSTGAFVAQLQEWRSWRDEHFNSGRVLGGAWASNTTEGRRRTAARQASQARRQQSREYKAAVRRQRAAERARRWREAQKAKSTAKPAPVKPGGKPKVDMAARGRDRTAFLMAMQKKYGQSNVDRASLKFKDGYWYVLVRVVRENASGDMRPEWLLKRAKAKV